MFNFRKKEAFRENNLYYDEPQGRDKGGVLAVWGSPGSGKTTVACKIAKYLAEKRKHCVILTCDMSAPMLPCIVPPSELEVEKSLGSILAATSMSESLVKYNLVTLKRNPNISLVGLLRGESEHTYAEYTAEQVLELLNVLKNIVPYVIVDCSSYLSSDILSAVALKNADEVIRLMNCDLKSISYLSTYMPLLANNGFEPERHYKVASNVKPNHGAEKMAGALGSLSFKLPHSSEVEEQYLEGNLLKDLTLKNSRAFRAEIQKISKEVFDVR